ncbi:hypothetical protein [Campylobacter canadensis]|uniref:hypothetical protein n=1 Tax=Campylobacter canadensis TaxID=449520 RepID=UPI001CCA62BD|nr:hypothetical protein [Campylobacter canadensis]MBZ8002379.1 hypothetical protein [Campylobacter canadensis]
MKKIFIFLIIAFSYVFADSSDNKTINFCGIINKEKYDFNYPKAMLSNEQLQERAKEFSGFNCSDVNQKYKDKKVEIVLSNIDFESGNYVCTVLANSSTTVKEDEEQNRIGKDKIQDEGLHRAYINETCKKDTMYFSNIAKDSFDEKKKKYYNTTISPKIIFDNSTNNKKYYFGSFFAGKDNKKITLATDHLRLSNIANELLYKTFSLRQQFDKTSPTITKATFDDNSTTISEVFTGLITVDTDYIEEGANSIVDETDGRLKIKDVVKEFAFDEKNNKTIINKFYKFLGLSETSIPVVSLTNSILDPYFWGWYAIFVENLKTVEYYLVLFLFFCGFSFLSAQHFLTYLKEKMKDNNKNTFSFSKIGILPFTMLITFTAPIIPSNLQINKELIYQSSNLNTSINLNTETKNETVQYFNSTLIQSGIRYMAKWGVMAANEVSKYALYTYNNYLKIAAYKQFNRALSLIKDDPLIPTAFQNFDLLYKQFAFYTYFCKPIYGNIYNNDNNFDNTIILKDPVSSNRKSDIRISNEQGYSPSQVINFRQILGFDRPTADVCAKLEILIDSNSKKTMSYYAIFDANFNQKDKNNNTKIDENEIVNTLNNTAILNNKLLTYQNNIGWIMSAVIPISYTMIKIVNIKEFFKQNKANSEVFINNSTNNKNDIIEYEKEDSWLSTISNWLKEFELFDIVQGAMYHLFYFVLPGFSDMYKAIEELMSNAGLTITVGFGFLHPVLFFVAGILFIVAKPMVSMLIAVSVYSNILKILIGVVALLMCLYKIAWYFIELMLFFVSSPVVAIWSVINKKDNVVYTYLGNALRLTLTPILTTLSVYIFIFSTEILTNLFSFLFTAFKSMYDDGAFGISTTLTVASISVITEIFLQFMYIVLAWIIIGKFTQWFWKSVGVNVSHMEEHSNDLFEKSKVMYGVKI